MFPSIGDYYRAAMENLRREVGETSDATALGRDATEWVDYLVAKYGMEPIKADMAAIAMEETSYRGSPVVLVKVPVEPSDTFDVIAAKAFVGQGAWFGFDYREFFSEDQPYTLGQVCPSVANEVNATKRRIGEYVQSLNSAIEHENRTFRGQVEQVVRARQEAVRAKHRSLDDLAAAVGIPIVKRADISAAVPAAVRVKKKIAPVVPPTPKLQERPVLERDKFEAIVELVDGVCRSFERTPSSFQKLNEEELRDIILSGLNTVFEGAAAGEVFQGLGKADIHLRISQGEVFVAEVKIWGGPATLAEVVRQLLERLTWRDAYGVAAVISNNADFQAVLRSLAETLPTLPGAAPASFRQVAPNVFSARFSLPADPARLVEIHVRAYSVYTSRRSGRAS
ncbi:MAG: hypothetical protein L0Z62_21940 [Gemmataceae bacterium]|nr:hypothetical protein [Gemmataceae bacterium]